MIEPVYVHVWFVRVFVCHEWQGDVCHYNGRTVPPRHLPICFSGAAFQMDFWRLLFHHISRMYGCASLKETLISPCFLSAIA